MISRAVWLNGFLPSQNQGQGVGKSESRSCPKKASSLSMVFSRLLHVFYPGDLTPHPLNLDDNTPLDWKIGSYYFNNCAISGSNFVRLQGNTCLDQTKSMELVERLCPSCLFFDFLSVFSVC